MSHPPTVVRGGHVLTMGPAGDIAGGAVAFADGAILAVGDFEEVARRFPGAEVVGEDHGVVLPGLVNAHTHLSEALLPGMGEDLTLFEWGTRLVTPAGRHLTREMARVGAMLKGAELLLGGVTTVNDMFCHTNMGSLASLGAVDGLEAMGLRGVVCFGAEDAFDPHPVAGFLDEHEALARRCGSSPLVGFRLGVGTLLGQSDALLAASARAAREHGWAVHTHLAEVREELVQARLRWGRSTVERAADARLLEVPVLAAHCVWVGKDEIGALAAAGASAVHNPVANMILASGVCPVPALRTAGIPVGLGPTGPPPTTARTCWRRSRRPPCCRRSPGSTPAPSPPATCSPWPPWRAPAASGWTAWSAPWNRASAPTWSGSAPTGPGWPTSTTPASRSSTAPPPPTWPTSGSTASAAWPTAA